MYDFAMIKGRLQQELTEVASTSKWNPMTVTLLQQMMKIYKDMEQVEKLECEEEEREKAETTTK